MFNPKDKLDKTLFKISTYVIITFAVAYALSRVLYYIPDMAKWLIDSIAIIINILSPLICGLIIAYLIWPLVFGIKKFLFKENKNNNNDTPLNIEFKEEIKEKLENKLPKTNKHKENKKNDKWQVGVSVIISYIIIIGLIVLLGYFTYIAIQEKFTSFQFENIIDEISEYIKKYDTKISEISDKILKLEIPDNIKNQLLDLTKFASNMIASLSTGIVNLIKNISKNVMNIFIGIIISFYIIVDYDFFKEFWKKTQILFIRKNKREKVNNFFKEINIVLSNFVRGQLLDCFIVALISIVVLLIINVDFAAILGIFAGIANIIPYFGPIIGMIPAVTIAIISGEPFKALMVIVGLAIVQQIDGNIIAPKIIGGSVGIHPVFVIIGVIIGAYFWGIAGMILAVPICGVIKVILNKIIDAKIKKEKRSIEKLNN